MLNKTNYDEKFFNAIDTLSISLGKIAKICDKHNEGSTFDMHFQVICNEIDKIAACFVMLKLKHNKFIIFEKPKIPKAKVSIQEPKKEDQPKSPRPPSAK